MCDFIKCNYVLGIFNSYPLTMWYKVVKVNYEAEQKLIDKNIEILNYDLAMNS